MKVLFIASGNKTGKPGAVVQNQADTLQNAGINIEFYLVYGKGIRGYINNIYPLYKYLKKSNAAVIHSHYSLSALVTSLALLFAPKRPHVVSLMGSDAKMKGPIKLLVKFFQKYYWKKTIVKSRQMIKDTGLRVAEVIPNGVDIKKIAAMENTIQNEIKDRSTDAKNTVLFAADPSRDSKNYQLAENAIKKTSGKLKVIYNQPHETVLAEIIKVDILLLTSLWEGSPNIIKEAMACNCPIVSTNVGDVEWLFGNKPGHFLTTFEPEDVAEKIELALEFSRKHVRTNGRERILELGLDAETVAGRILGVYREVLSETKGRERLKGR